MYLGCWCTRHKGTKGLVGPGWMGFWGHPWFFSYTSPSTHPALPGTGYCCVQPTCLVQVCWPGTHRNVESSSPLRLAPCKLRANIDRGWAKAGRISPAGERSLCCLPRYHTTLTKALGAGTAVSAPRLLVFLCQRGGGERQG